MKMRTFLIPIGIGFLLIILFFIRMIGIGSAVPISPPPTHQDQSKVKLTPRENAGKTSRGLSERTKVSNDFKPLESLAITPVEHKFKTFYDNGALSSEWSFKNARLNGAFKTYYDNQATWTAFNFQNGQLEGVGKAFYPDGALFRETNYMRGKPDGHLKQYYEKGERWFDMILTYGILTKAPEIYSENGESAQGAILHPAVSADDGIYQMLTSYYLNQKVSSAWNLKNGVLDGVTTIYYKDGSPMCELNFKNGQFSGEAKCFYGSGELLNQTSYSQGLAEGVENQYYKSGAKWIETEFREGKIKIFPKAYSENGKTPEEKNHVKG